MQRYALIGRKLGHSYSPLIHEAFGCESYGLMELEPENLASFLETTAYRGFNVTIPYKKAVMPLCVGISEIARECGSVNTLSRLPDGGEAEQELVVQLRDGIKNDAVLAVVKILPGQDRVQRGDDLVIQDHGADHRLLRLYILGLDPFDLTFSLVHGACFTLLPQ